MNLILLTAVLVNFVIVSAIIFSGFTGAKRGLVLIGLELASFVIATLVALAAYHPVGSAIKSLAHVTDALGNIAGFLLVWVFVEVACALISRFLLLPHLGRHTQLSLPNRIGGG